ncbi:serine phosphatase RsbU, regulator of sigma subunit [Saprospira grandis DSM 2844]|uniref:Serine phosphatase RsbU, regulator of sigma subunit n=1 Tax=Saprospira grandis DSM 2844 TaxID=694433 RepID=J1I368_9BACT|nr:PP2C family protein-serine/threonine phosphatase [Saprospira grandis]EJF52753.1 serine phosphatase RsbU, regulator of sigma subunit [Saprospira grandis DSM 2844]
MDSQDKTSLPQIEELEHKLYLQQLQINRLSEITQAINNNIKIQDLFKIYTDTLSWEMGAKRFALYSCKDGDWQLATHKGIDEKLLVLDISDYFLAYQRIAKIGEDHPLLCEFNYVIPVYHKEEAIAFAFVYKEARKGEDLFESIRFIGTLTNVVAVAIENKRLFKRQLAQEKMRHELRLANQVQNMLIPSKLPNNQRFNFSGIYQPHEGVGGDYYDFMELNEDEIAFCIADISGKGISAAILMSNFQANLQTLIHRKDLKIPEFVDRLNEKVLKATRGDRFITFFVARYNRSTGRLLYLNAGHNPPFLYRNGQVERLDKGCTILGIVPKIPKLEWGEIYLKEDAFFFLYTDGLTDLRNEAGQTVEEEAIADFISRHHQLSANDFNAALMQEMQEFKGHMEFPDDISILTGHIFATKEQKKQTETAKMTVKAS